MTHRVAFLGIFALLAACGDGAQERSPEEVTLDTFNVALAGAFIPYEMERRQPLADAIAASEADVICLQEVWSQADKEMIQTAAAQSFPNAVIFKDDLDTLIDDPTDQQGQVPQTPSGVPCPDVDVAMGSTIVDQMNEAIDCLRDNCSTIPGSDDGRTTSAGCAADACVPSVVGLLFGDAQQQRCYACVITQLPTDTFDHMRTSCSTVENQDLAFGGQNGVMLLSRYPVKNETNWVLPGTWNRRTILSATVELPNGAELDTYCNHLTPIFTDFTFPYTGQYGEGMTDAGGWQAEQELQAQKLIDYVASTSGDRPAVILGDLNASHAFPAEDIVAEGEDTLNLLESAFEPAYASDYTPACTFCSTNPVTNPDHDPDATSGWIDHIMLENFSTDSVVSTERVYDADVVDVGDGTRVPLSDHFGMRSVIVVP